APALTLEEGWNLIGVPFECPIPDCAVDSVWEWIDRRYAAAAVLEPGKAYWLYSSEDRTIRLAAPQE
ncbi:MAG: hypothetical protein KAI66_21465, partial [Lentisphaeria bacterium]|nr:hypothetical protein [Lentisphaeria bacterium]